MSDIKRYFKQGQIEKIAHIIGETNSGLSGTEIHHLLESSKIDDVDPQNTKWKRLFNAFVTRHNKTNSDNFILSFIAKALEPSRFADDLDHYSYLISQVNIVLAFNGLEFQDDGNFHTIKKAETLTEAAYRCRSLKKAIKERNLHSILLKYCNEELLHDNYFHAVLESVKGIASIIREKTGLTNDGANLVNEAFGGDNPKLKINGFSTETEKSEQRGFVNLLIGLFGTFRNPTAHAAKIEWNLEEQDALDIFSMVSYCIRRIVEAD
jgi:uncharacterized protein (TIGR02391 family)